MRRGINFQELFFLALFFARGTQTKVFGEVPSWFVVFLPFLLAAIFDILEAYFKTKSIPERIRFFLWKRMINRLSSNARKTTEKEFKDAYLKGKAAANPGQHYDNK